MSIIYCKVVQDLIPLYVEKISSEESNILIEEHIEKCEECKKILKESEQSLFSNNKSLKNKDFLTEKEESEIFKKIMQKYRKNAMKKIKVAILAVIAIMIILCGVTYAWRGNYLTVSYEDAVLSTYIVKGERTQNEYFHIQGEGVIMERTWEGNTLVFEGRNSHEYRKWVEETGQLYVTHVNISDPDIERIVYRDDEGDHVVWEKNRN